MYPSSLFVIWNVLYAEVVLSSGVTTVRWTFWVARFFFFAQIILADMCCDIEKYVYFQISMYFCSFDVLCIFFLICLFLFL